MRHAAMLLLGIALLAPTLASADRGQGSGECRHLTSQIDFFETRLERAEALGNDLWRARLETHLSDLVERRSTSCPEYSDAAQAAEAMRQLQELMALAAKGALTFFTMGAY
jgi:hypothetical protein